MTKIKLNYKQRNQILKHIKNNEISLEGCTVSYIKDAVVEVVPNMPIDFNTKSMVLTFTKKGLKQFKKELKQLGYKTN